MSDIDAYYERPLKRCSKCGAAKERTEFSIDQHSGDGLRCQCKTCSTETAKEHSEKVKEEGKKEKWVEKIPVPSMDQLATVEGYDLYLDELTVALARGEISRFTYEAFVKRYKAKHDANSHKLLNQKVLTMLDQFKKVKEGQQK